MTVELVSLAELEPALAAERPFEVARVLVSCGATAPCAPGPCAPGPCALPRVAYTLERPRGEAGGFAIGDWTTTWADEYPRAIETVRRAIFEGDVYQVNLVQHLRAPFAGDPLGLARALAPLRPLEPAPLEGYGWAIVSASPECSCRSAAARSGRARSRAPDPPACTSTRRRTRPST